MPPVAWLHYPRKRAGDHALHPGFRVTLQVCLLRCAGIGHTAAPHSTFPGPTPRTCSRSCPQSRYAEDARAASPPIASPLMCLRSVCTPENEQAAFDCAIAMLERIHGMARSANGDYSRPENPPPMTTALATTAPDCPPSTPTSFFGEVSQAVHGEIYSGIYYDIEYTDDNSARHTRWRVLKSAPATTC